MTNSCLDEQLFSWKSLHPAYLKHKTLHFKKHREQRDTWSSMQLGCKSKKSPSRKKKLVECENKSWLLKDFYVGQVRTKQLLLEWWMNFNSFNLEQEVNNLSMVLVNRKMKHSWEQHSREEGDEIETGHLFLASLFSADHKLQASMLFTSLWTLEQKVLKLDQCVIRLIAEYCKHWLAGQ